MTAEEKKIVNINCRAKSPGTGSDGEYACKGRTAVVVRVLRNSDGDVGGGHVSTYQCETCNRKFVITT